MATLCLIKGEEANLKIIVQEHGNYGLSVVLTIKPRENMRINEREKI
jgi:hypothetical protein